MKVGERERVMKKYRMRINTEAVVLEVMKTSAWEKAVGYACF